jgi:hypothetical protein
MWFKEIKTQSTVLKSNILINQIIIRNWLLYKLRLYEILFISFLEVREYVLKFLSITKYLK